MPHPPAPSRSHDRPSVGLDVVVIGGGQAGLAIGYFLARGGRDFTILEAADEPAAAWRERWDSLRLFTPVRYSSLPGLPFPGDPDSYPSRDEVAAYLTEYADRFELPVELESRVRSLRADRRRLSGRARRPQLRGEAGCRRHRPVSGPPRAGDRRAPGPRRRPAPQQRLSGAGRDPGRAGARRRRWQHRLSDRRGAGGFARGPPLDRLAPDAVAPTGPRPRPVLVPRRHRADPQDDRVADRPADGAAGTR